MKAKKFYGTIRRKTAQKGLLRVFTVSLLITLSGVTTTPGLAQIETKLTASDPAAAARFGDSVAISADGATALVGTPYKDDVARNSGAAYVFTWDGTGWSQQAKLTAVGAYGENGYTGSAYVFTRDGTGWSEQAKLTASDAAANDEFGFSVALSGDGATALVGSPYDDGVGVEYSGAAYVFMYGITPPPAGVSLLSNALWILPLTLLTGGLVIRRRRRNPESAP